MVDEELRFALAGVARTVLLILLKTWGRVLRQNIP